MYPGSRQSRLSALTSVADRAAVRTLYTPTPTLAGSPTLPAFAASGCGLASEWHALEAPAAVRSVQGGRFARVACEPSPGGRTRGAAAGAPCGPGATWAGQSPPVPCSLAMLGMTESSGSHGEGGYGRWSVRMCAHVLLGRCTCTVNTLLTVRASRSRVKIARKGALLLQHKNSFESISIVTTTI